MESNGKKVHFYLPKSKIDVENQTFFNTIDQFQYDNNFYERQYQAAINSLFDTEPLENEIDRTIKYDYSTRVPFYMTKLYDSRFEPLTPSNNLFNDLNPKICLEIRNEGFVIWKCTNEDFSTNPNLYRNNRQVLTFSFDNNSSTVYSIIQSFITKRINSILLRIFDKLQIMYGDNGNILCEIADFRFNANNTYSRNFDDQSIIRKRINLKVDVNSIYYFILLAKYSFMKKKNNLKNSSSNFSNHNSSNLIKKNESAPNLNTNQIQSNNGFNSNDISEPIQNHKDNSFHISIHNSNQTEIPNPQIQQKQFSQQPTFSQIPSINNESNNNSNKQEESQTKPKSKSHSSNSSNDPINTAFSSTCEAEKNTILILHPTICTDPSPDVCRAKSILDFREKMWNQDQSLFVKNFDQMKLNSFSDNENAHFENHIFYPHPPQEKIIVPETITQMFSAKDKMTINFSTY